ncbi:hypothetical protein [Streptomyces sp. SLBN-118]|uniref:hypothetical protein n=1 Tax=Streptomyces sp. SLBN-118 TaxID=2768454 RepID=UPI001642C5F8|nr:hypothetical protein [Streptomyces sp. SLBN-118]
MEGAQSARADETYSHFQHSCLSQIFGDGSAALSGEPDAAKPHHAVPGGAALPTPQLVVSGHDQLRESMSEGSGDVNHRTKRKTKERRVDHVAPEETQELRELRQERAATAFMLIAANATITV